MAPLEGSFINRAVIVKHPWFLLSSGSAPAALNMALDEALLESAAALTRPVLRFYGWTENAATFGYFQRISEVRAWTPLRPLIRRPTGGGLVPHDADWTYSLVVPPSHSWFSLKAIESYRQMHQWIQRSFASLGLSTHLAPAPRQASAGQCFTGAERFDLLSEGKKVAGAAQRRNRHGLLIQGSIQPGNITGSRTQWEVAMLASGPETIEWLPLKLAPELARRADELARDKYSQPSYNERR